MENDKSNCGAEVFEHMEFGMNIARPGRRAFKIMNVNTTLKDCFC